MISSTSMKMNFFIVLLGLASLREVFSFGIIPTPAGLSQEAILTMAQRRYSKASSLPNSEPNKFPMTGRVAVITGAAGGIGGELAQLIYNLGGTVVGLDRNAKGLKELEKNLKGFDAEQNSSNNESPGSVWTLEAHHEDLASVASTADQILSRYESIDILINNAGLTYRQDSIPGQPHMMAANGKDLSFTVNYLSHFLLTEKLLPSLSKAKDGGRVVHITSTYHWKVDGSELIPQLDGSGPIAYQYDPSKQGPKHVERAYANSKMAQIWHSRSIDADNCSSVCACPTWAATGIGGDDARAFLQQYAFSIDNCGPGVTSSINAIFKSDGELGDALNDGMSFVANSRILEKIVWREALLSGDFVTNTLKWRDGLTDLLGLVLLLGQKFTYEMFLIQKTSPDTNNNHEGRKALYDWSQKEVEKYL